MTVSEALSAAPAQIAETKGARARARARTRDMVAEGDLVVADPGIRQRLADAAEVVADDFRGAWLWEAHGPSIRTLMQGRVPPMERVPGRNAALRAAWTAYNHTALILTVPLLFTAWVLCHPGRLLYALPIAAALAAVWLI